jgi:hypothetical protein
VVLGLLAVLICGAIGYLAREASRAQGLGDDGSQYNAPVGAHAAAATLDTIPTGRLMREPERWVHTSARVLGGAAQRDDSSAGQPRPEYGGRAEWARTPMTEGRQTR